MEYRQLTRSFGAHFGVLLLVRHEWQGGVDISGNSGLGNENNEYDSDDSLTNSNSLGNNHGMKNPSYTGANICANLLPIPKSTTFDHLCTGANFIDLYHIATRCGVVIAANAGGANIVPIYCEFMNSQS